MKVVDPALFGSQLETSLKFRCLHQASFATLLFFASSALGQSQSLATTKPAVDQRGFTFTEAYEGSGNSDGFITDLDSSVGYIFHKHFAVGMGVPYFFVQPSTSKTGTTSASGIGNPSFGVRYSTKLSALDFGTSVNSSVPIASTANGFSTGHVTFDWSTHFAHEFSPFTPLFDMGVANSVQDSRFLHRAYTSYGDLSHFEGGSQLDLGDKVSFTATGYYILPWGSQQIFLRGKKKSSLAQSGASSLTKDDGVNLGFDYNWTRSLDLSAGYSHSAENVLNTFSFGIAFSSNSSHNKNSTR